MVKAYLHKMLVLEKFTSVVVNKHNIVDDWYFIHLTGKNENDELRVLVTYTGVLNFEGRGNFKTLEVLNAINLIIDEEYYDFVIRQTKQTIKNVEKMAKEQ